MFLITDTSEIFNWYTLVFVMNSSFQPSTPCVWETPESLILQCTFFLQFFSLSPIFTSFLSILVSLVHLFSHSLASTLLSSPVLNLTLVNSNQGWNCLSLLVYMLMTEHSKEGQNHLADWHLYK